MYKGDEIFEKLFQFINTLEIIDTHEHLPGREENRDRNTDILGEYVPQYFGRDLVSAGLPKGDYNKIGDQSISLTERFLMLEPYWELSRLTGYGRSLDHAVRLLYGEDGIHRENIERLNEKFTRGLKSGKQFQRVLKEVSKIKVSVIDADLDCDSRYFKSVFRFDSLILPNNMSVIDDLSSETGVIISCFEDYLEATQILFEKLMKKGIRVLKSGLAYVRSLKYDRALKSQAESDFNRAVKLRYFPDWDNPALNMSEDFQNYMMHFILKLAARQELTYQIHTGFQEGNGNKLSNTNPTLLENLFTEYPTVMFDVFHMGYPFQKQAGILGKMYANVSLDMCWANIISPGESVEALYNWLDLMPYNKISAFGGDYGFVDGVAGHQYLARENVARALSLKVKENYFTFDKACHIAEHLLFKNPQRILQLVKH